MSGKRYSTEEIISKLREAAVNLAEGLTVGEAIRRLGVNKITYDRCRKEFGGVKVDQASHLKSASVSDILTRNRDEVSRRKRGYEIESIVISAFLR